MMMYESLGCHQGMIESFSTGLGNLLLSRVYFLINIESESFICVNVRIGCNDSDICCDVKQVKKLNRNPESSKKVDIFQISTCIYYYPPPPHHHHHHHHHHLHHHCLYHHRFHFISLSSLSSSPS